MDKRHFAMFWGQNTGNNSGLFSGSAVVLLKGAPDVGLV